MKIDGEIAWTSRRQGLLRQQAYIGGAWVDAADRLAVVDPATGASVGSVPNLGEAETLQAIGAAQAAFAGWSMRGARERANVLRRWHAGILARAEELAQLITAEQGKPIAEARAEIASSAAYVEWFADEARRLYGDTIPGHQANKRLAVIKQPVGVVAAITPWNFPSAMIARKVAPALAAGCTVVLKPAEATPFSALALAALAEEAGVPAGVFNVVTGDPEPIGRALTDDPRVRKFTFTGSTRVGTMLAQRAMATVKRVSLELGGNAPFIVFDDAGLDAAVTGALQSKFRNSGQTCVCANRFLVQQGIHDAFAARLAEAVDALVLGNGAADGITQGPLINQAAVAKVQRHIDDALARGARAITERAPAPVNDSWFAPTVLVDVDPASLMCREETFGPVAGLVKFRNEAEAAAIANATEAGLAAYVYTRDLDRSWRMTEALDYGMVGINTGLLSTEAAPFGGIKQSGLGREGSKYGLDDYVSLKTVCVEIGEAA